MKFDVDWYHHHSRPQRCTLCVLSERRRLEISDPNTRSLIIWSVFEVDGDLHVLAFREFTL